MKIFINESYFSRLEGLYMGRIKPRPLKSVSENLYAEYTDEFTESFEDNKQVVARHALVQSKKLRNIIAGYATRMKKNN